MDSFRWIAVALSMILGLGITRLLASFVAVFRSRNRSRLDWIPLAWAFCIFIFHLQFWWAINELPGLVHIWTLSTFLALVGLTLLLFISAALILPYDELEEEESLLSAPSSQRNTCVSSSRFIRLCHSARMCRAAAR